MTSAKDVIARARTFCKAGGLSLGADAEVAIRQAVAKGRLTDEERRHLPPGVGVIVGEMVGWEHLEGPQ